MKTIEVQASVGSNPTLSAIYIFIVDCDRRMVQSKAAKIEDYLKELPAKRREIVGEIRNIILNNLPDGYEEVMQYGMISYVVPFSIYPKTYNKMPLAYVSIASQKNYISLYLMAVYGDKSTEENFKKEYLASGKKINMGKSCIRFTKLDDIPLEIIGKVVSNTPVKEFIRIYERSRPKKSL